MSKYTQIFTTPYVPKYGPVPLSEVGQMMKERKQVIDQSMLNDQRTMAMLDRASMGLSESERDAVYSAVEPFYKDIKQRVESGDYNIRDIDYETKRGATRIAGILEGVESLKEQRQKDIDAFYKNNKDADPIQLQAMLAVAGMPTIKLDEETGLPTLEGSVANIRIPEFEEQREREYGVLEPIPTESIDLTRGASIAGTPRNIGIKDILSYALPAGNIFHIQRESLKSLAESSEDVNILKRDFKESIREQRPELTENQLEERTRVAFEKYVNDNTQIEGSRFERYTPEEAKEMKDYYSRDNQIYNHKFFIPETGERLSVVELYEKYATNAFGSVFKNVKDFIDNGLSLSGETIDETGQYTISGSGVVGSLFDGTQVVMDKENVSLLNQEAVQISSKLSNPLYVQPIKLKRRGTGDDSDTLFDLTITKDIVHMLNGKEVPPDEEGSTPTIIYRVERNDGEVSTYSTYDSYNEIFNNVINPGKLSQ